MPLGSVGRVACLAPASGAPGGERLPLDPRRPNERDISNLNGARLRDVSQNGEFQPLVIEAVRFSIVPADAGQEPSPAMRAFATDLGS